MPSGKLDDLKYANEGFHRSRVGSGYRNIGKLTINCTSVSGTYAYALDRVFSPIIKIRDVQ